MNVWNGTHPVEENTKGYDVRGLDADVDLTNYEFLERVS